MKLAALTLLASFVSCDTIVTPTQTVTQGPGASGSASSPTVSPRGNVSAIDEVLVELVDVAAGCAEASGLVHLGCVARITATPRASGVVVPPALHGPICTWFLDGVVVAGSASTDIVYVTNTSNPFNVAVYGQGPGTFVLEAEVLSVRSRPRRFVVR